VKQLSHFWSFGDVSQVSLAAMLNVDANHTLPNWFNMHWDLCIDWVAMHMQHPIGGPGNCVQIDEMLISKLKTTRNTSARPTPQQWVFGGLDTTTQEAFLVEVPRRNAATLLPMIQKHVAPGTTIWSDQWAAYRQITAVAPGTTIWSDQWAAYKQITAVAPGTTIWSNQWAAYKQITAVTPGTTIWSDQWAAYRQIMAVTPGTTIWSDQWAAYKQITAVTPGTTIWSDQWAAYRQITAVAPGTTIWSDQWAVYRQITAVTPGTTIWSDQWAAYRQITAATGLQHETINHSLHFVAPQSAVNTNAVENLWCCAKDKFKSMYGTSQAHITSYLDEFLWCRKYGTRDECFENAMQMMRWHYPVLRLQVYCTAVR